MNEAMSSGCVVGTMTMTTCGAVLRLDRLRAWRRAPAACCGVSVRGLVDDAAAERRHRHEILRRAAPLPSSKAATRSDERAHRAHATDRVRDAQRGADAGLLKSTVGGTEICASFCTVKLGLAL